MIWLCSSRRRLSIVGGILSLVAAPAVSGEFIEQLLLETPRIDFDAVEPYFYDPDPGAWSVVAVRPLNVGGANYTLRMYDDALFDDLLATSGAYPNVEFIAVDYNHASASNDYPQTTRVSGGDPNTVEWAQGSLMTDWASDHIYDLTTCRVWDVSLRGGQEYFFRQYNIIDPENINCGLYLMSSASGDHHIQRSGAAAGSNDGVAGNGEWFHYTAPVDDEYGLVLVKNNQSTGTYRVGYGPRFDLSANVAESYPENLGWTSFDVAPLTWNVVATRTPIADWTSVEYSACEEHASACEFTTGAARSQIQFVAVNGNVAPVGEMHARFEWEYGPGVGWTYVSTDPGGRLLSLSDPTGVAQAQASFSEGEVAHAWTVKASGDLDYPLQLTIRVTPEGFRDTAFYFLRGDDGWVQTRADAATEVDDAGQGEAEELHVSLLGPGEHAVIVANLWNGEMDYDIRMFIEGSIVDVDSPGRDADLALRSLSSNPVRGAATFAVDVPSPSDVRLDVFDAAGRQVRTLLDGPSAAGTVTVDWDGATADGRAASAGIYFARLRVAGEILTRKIVRVD